MPSLCPIQTAFLIPANYESCCHLENGYYVYNEAYTELYPQNCLTVSATVPGIVTSIEASDTYNTVAFTAESVTLGSIETYNPNQDRSSIIYPSPTSSIDFIYLDYSSSTLPSRTTASYPVVETLSVINETPTYLSKETPTYPKDTCNRYVCDPIILDINPNIVRNTIGNNFTVVGYHFDAVDFILSDPANKTYPVALLKKIGINYLLNLPSIAFVGSTLRMTLSVVPMNKDARNSSFFNFILFNPDIITIQKEIVYVKTYVNQVSAVQVTLAQLLPDMKPICAFTVRTLTDTYVLYANPYSFDTYSKSIICIFSLVESASVFVDILFSRVWNYFNLDESNLLLQYSIPFNTSRIPARIYRTAPVILASYIYDKAYTIAVLFSDPFEIFRESETLYTVYTNLVPCSFVFENKTDAILSIDPEDCIIQKCGRIMKLKFKKSFLQKNAKYIIKPGQSLRVLDKSIRYANSPYSDSKSSETLIGPYLGESGLNVNVSVPKNIGLCESLIIDFKFSVNFPLASVYMNLYSSYDDLNLKTLNQELNSQSQSIISGASKRIVLGPLYLAVQGLKSRLYNLKINIKDIFNQSSEQVYSFYRNESLVDPWSSLFLVGAADPIASYMTNSIWFSQLLQVPDLCTVSLNGVNFTWNIQGNVVNAINSTSSVLKIPPFSLYPKSSYNVNVSASLGLGKSSLSKLFSIQTLPDSINVHIGSTFIFGQNQNVSIIPYINDPHYSPQRQPEFQCQWTCKALETVPCYLSIKLNVCSLFFKNSLSVGKYRFSLLVSNPLTGSTAIPSITNIRITSESVPIVRLVPSRVNPSSSDNGFSIQAIIDVTSVSSFKNTLFSWYSLPQCSSGTTGNTLDLSSKNVIAVIPARNVLKFRPNVLTPGQTYCVGLDLIDTGYATSVNSTLETQFTVLNLPYGGACASSIEEVNGVISLVEFEESVQFICSDWQTDSVSYPLYYRFERQRLSSFKDDLVWNNWIQMGLSSTKNTATVILSSGHYKVRVNVSDASGSMMSYSKLFSISVSTSSNLNTKTILDQLIKATTSYDLDTLIMITSAISTLDQLTNLQYMYKRDTSISDLLIIQSAALQSYYDILSNNSLTLDDATSRMISGNLKRLIGTNCNLPNSNSVLALNTFILLITNTRDVAVQLGTSLSWDTIDNFISILDTFSCVVAQTSLNFDFLRSTMNSILLQIAQSSLLNSVCGEILYSVTKTSISLILGKANQAQITYGNFTFTSLDLSSISTSGCPAYMTGIKSPKLYVANNSAVVSSDISELSFLNDGLNDIVSPSNSSVQFTLPYNVGSSALCAFVVYKSSTVRDFNSSYLSTDGCTKTAVTGKNFVLCNCNHLTDFLSIQESSITVTTQDNINYSPSTSGETKSNVGMIVGVSVAVISLLAVIGGFVFVRSRRGVRVSKYVRHEECD